MRCFIASADFRSDSTHLRRFSSGASLLARSSAVVTIVASGFFRSCETTAINSSRVRVAFLACW